MKFVCETCELAVSTLSQWVGHLVGETHQNKSQDLEDTSISVMDSEGRVLNFVAQMPKVFKWDENDRKRSVMVTGYVEKKISYGMLGVHFSVFGFITDFIADTEKGYAVVQFDSRESVNRILQHCGNCVVQGKSCKIQGLEEITDLEWLLMLELDSVCTKAELPNLVQHTLMMSSIREYTLLDQFVFWLYRTSVIGQDIVIRQAMIKDLQCILRVRFPSVYCYNMTILYPGFVDFDEPIEIYVDPFAHCGAAYNTPLQPDYICFKYQQAIQHILYNLQNQTVGNMKVFHEISTIHNSDFPGGSSVITGINFSQNGIPCRLRFDSAMDANVSSLVSFYVSLDPRVLPFLRFIHYWGRLHGLTTKYPEFKRVLTMMGLIHLQRKYIIPSVSMLQQLAYSSNSITGHSWVEGCNVAFSRDIVAINAYLKSKGKDTDFSTNPNGDGSTASLVSLDNFIPQIVSHKTINAVLECLVEFFHAFGTNDLKLYIASPFMGNLFFKSTVAHQNVCDNDLAIMRIKELCGGLDLTPPLIVQHPFDLKKNIAENIDSQFMLFTQGLFREMAGRVRKAVFDSNRNLLCAFPDILPHLHRVQGSKRRDRDSGCSSLLFELAKSESLAELNSAKPATKKNKSPDRPCMSYSNVAKKAASTLVPATGPQISNSVVSPCDSYLSPCVKCMKFELSKQFRISFLETCQGMGGLNRLKEKMVILAVIFMRDFSWSTWGRCYYLQNDTTKIADSDPKYQQITRMFKEYFSRSPSKNGSGNSDSQVMSGGVDCASSRLDSSGYSDDNNELTIESGSSDSSPCGSVNEKSPSNQALASVAASDNNGNGWSYVQRKGTDASDKVNVTSTSKFRDLSEKDKNEDIRMKFGKIPKCACKNYCVTMKLKGFHRIWINRRAKRLAMMSRNPNSKCSVNLLQMKETELLINPMDKEWALTDSVCESIQGHGGKFPAARALWGFEATVKIDLTGEFPVLYMAMKEGRSPKVCQNMFEYFGTVFPELYAEYMMYRLKKWVVTPAGGSASANGSQSF